MLIKHRSLLSSLQKAYEFSYNNSQNLSKGIAVNEPQIAKTPQDVVALLIEKRKEFNYPKEFIVSFGRDELGEFEKLNGDMDMKVGDLLSMSQSVGSSVGESLKSVKKYSAELIKASDKIKEGGLGAKFINFLLGKDLAAELASKYQSVSSLFEEITANLKHSINVLEARNAEISEKQKELSLIIESLKGKIEILSKTDELIENLAANQTDEEQKKFLLEEALFYIRMHLQNLQQVLVVMQQSLANYATIKHNNSLLSFATQNTITTSITALKTNVYIASAAQEGKKQLKAVSEMDKLANDVILKNAQDVNDTATDVMAKVAGGALDNQNLEKAINLMIDSLDKIENFKNEALPKMKENIAKIAQMSKTLESKVNKLEKIEQSDVYSIE